MIVSNITYGLDQYWMSQPGLLLLRLILGIIILYGILKGVYSSMLDALLLPRAYYKSMPVSKRTFLFAICAVGALQLGYPFLFEEYKQLFIGKSPVITLYNIVLAVVLMFVLGFSEIMVFCMPVTDLFKYISKKKGGSKDNLLLIKFIKIYTLASLIITPVYIFVMNTIFKDINGTQDIAKINIYNITLLLIQLWIYGILCRGLNCLLKSKGPQKALVFIVVYGWSQIWGYVYQYIFDNVVTNLFR